MKKGFQVALNKVNICNVWIHNISMDETLLRVEELIQIKKPSYVVTPTVDHVIKLQKDLEFREVYENAALVLPDGMPLLWAGYFLGTPLKERVCGSDLLPSFCKIAADRGYRIFFLGGEEGVAHNAEQVLKAQYPFIKIVGTYSPPFGFDKEEDKNRQIVEMIRAAKPDILFVGLGAPKQEKWIYKFKDSLQVPVSIGAGISFDFIAGNLKRAPKWIRNIGLEWFWRLAQEPKRLWKRYLVDDPVFFWLVLKQKLGCNLKPRSV